jgi:pseudaminic acid biosynthesis-associated methylase
MKTTDLWSGAFGNAYIERNRLDFKPRMPFWESAIQFTTPASVFEFGCNIGLNLRAIQSVSPNTMLYGADINANAVNEARAAGLEVQHIGEHGIAGLYEPGTMDLTFTAGVLIHVAPADLERTMRSLVELSGRYVLAIEYHEDEGEVEVEYRGQKGALWRRNYGKLYQDLGLNLLSVGPAAGFDDCTFYLLERPQQ